MGTLLRIAALSLGLTAQPPLGPGWEAEREAQAWGEISAPVEELHRLAEEASQAIGQGESARASTLLEQVEAGLGALSERVPEQLLLSQLDAMLEGLRAPQSAGAPGLDFGPLLSTLRREDWLDPGLLESAVEAGRRSDRGDPRGAAGQLTLARERLRTEVGLRPLQQARAQLRRAREALLDGHRQRAERLLSEFRSSLSELAREAPLVAVRFELREAGRAAQQGHWAEARALSARAQQRLQQSAPGSEEQCRLAGQARALLRRIGAG